MDHAARVYEHIFEMLPNEENPSPMVRIGPMNPRPEHPLYAKLEWFNPFGSVKDRAAWYLLKQMREQGIVGNGRGLVEPTSGNTGISLAIMASVLGIHMKAIVPNKVPREKKMMLKLAGADLEVLNDELCPAPGMGEGSINLAKTYAKAQKDKYAMPNQYENPANVEAHVETTGPEIWRQTKGKVSRLFVSLGTCGTVTGTSKFLKSKNPAIKVYAVQPTEGHDVPGLRNVQQLAVSKLYDASLIDEILEVDFELAYTCAAELCRREGLLAGPSSGLIFAGATRVIERDGGAADEISVALFPDNVFKYTTNMAKHIPMLAENIDASRGGGSS